MLESLFTVKMLQGRASGALFRRTEFFPAVAEAVLVCFSQAAFERLLPFPGPATCLQPTLFQENLRIYP